jgi:D-alanyl-D-alanine endopeptidase (penicillin-binding protein 7)
MRHFLMGLAFWSGLQVFDAPNILVPVALAQSSATNANASGKGTTAAKDTPSRQVRPQDSAKGPPAKAAQQAQRTTPQRPAQQSAARPAPKSSQPPVVRKPANPSSMAKKPATAQKKVVRDPANVMSAGTRLGLRSALSDVALNSSAVMVIDQISGEVLIEKNPDAVLPIASITKLMTALVVLDAGLPLEDLVMITKEDADLEKNPVSRLPVGAKFTRGELMHLSLMSSENRAAHALARTYPGGMNAFVAAMNIKALKIGMTQARFTEPTGLNSGNVASPRDLVRLVEESYLVPEIREYSTSRDLMVRVRGRPVQFMNSNALARGEGWDLGVSKTGFIRDAGRCLVMQADFESRPVIMVMLDAQGKQHRERDAQRIREFILQQAGEGRPSGGA